MEMSIRFDHTAVVNIVFLAIAAVLLWRFFRTGGANMLRHMNEPMSPQDHMGGHQHHHGMTH